MKLEDKVDPRVNIANINCLEQIFHFSQALRIYDKKIQLYDTYQAYIQYLL
jgi:hypothetical protein